MTAIVSDDAEVTSQFRRLPMLLEQHPYLAERGRFVDIECLLGTFSHAFHVSIKAGRITELVPAPVLMRSWSFAYRATAVAWSEHWQPMPRAGWHDLLALTKRGEAKLDGDVKPFITHLQYFKDLLVLPRREGDAT